MKIKIVIISISTFIFWISSLFVNSVYAQQDSQYTQYMYNTISINPAYAGNRDVLSINSLYRAQWLGLEGAPRTLSLSINSPVGVKGVGLGLSVVQDKIGPTNETFAAIDFSYTIKTSDRIELSFGLKGGFNLLDVDFSKLNYNPSDPYAINIENRFSPAIGVGVYLTSNDTWYVGISSPNILETDHYDDLTFSTASEKAHIYLIGGYVFILNNNLKFKPSVLAKTVAGAPLSLDFSANFLINDKFTIGAAYRLDSAVSALIGFQLSDALMLGYGYDYDTMELGNYNSGSHEFFLRYELPTRSRKYVNPRFF